MPRAFLMNARSKTKVNEASEEGPADSDMVELTREVHRIQGHQIQTSNDEISGDRWTNLQTKREQDAIIRKVWQPFIVNETKSEENDIRCKSVLDSSSFTSHLGTGFTPGFSSFDPLIIWMEIQRRQFPQLNLTPDPADSNNFDDDDDNDNNNDDDDNDDDDDDDDEENEKCHLERGGNMVLKSSENVRPWSSQSSNSAIMAKENSGAMTTEYNPFINCPPLTSNVDTERLYPKIRTTGTERGRILALTNNSTNNNNDNNNRDNNSYCNQNKSHSVSSTDNCLLQPLSNQCNRPPYHPYQTYHLQTKVRVTDFVLHRRYLTFPCPPPDQHPLPSVTTFKLPPSSDPHVTAMTSEPEDGRTHRLPVPRFQCGSCLKSYSTTNGLSKHREFHCPASTGGQPRPEYRCHQCEKAYTSVSALKMHIRTHTLPCRCKLCGKAFSRPWLLQGHLRTHTGEKPFQCNHCGRAFADRSNLRAHLQTHYEVKQYNCQACHKTFSRMSLLLKHQHNSCV